MDIIVTTPKSEIETSRIEGEKYKEWFRTFKNKPNVKVNDRIYFVEEGFIVGYGTICSFFKCDDKMMCEETGREWGNVGDWVIVYEKWHWLAYKQEMKGFQGFRYYSYNIIPHTKVGGFLEE